MAFEPSATPSAEGTPAAAPVAPAPAAPPVSVGAPASPVAPAGGQPAPMSTPEPSAQAPAPSNTFRVKVDGQWKEVDLDELQRGYIAQSTFTQRQQQLANERRQWEQAQHQNEMAQWQAKQELEQYRQLLTDPNKVGQYYRALAAQHGFDPNAPDPSARPLTASEANALMESRLHKMQQRFDQELQSKTGRLEEVLRQREVAASKSVFDRYLDSVVADHPEIGQVYDTEEFKRAVRNQAGQRLRYAAESGQPIEDWNEAGLAELRREAAARVEKLKSILVNQQRMTAASTPSQVQGGLEPPGGRAPATPPQAPLRLGSPELRARATALVEQRLAGG